MLWSGVDFEQKQDSKNPVKKEFQMKGCNILLSFSYATGKW
jgi:hypothetical protein